MLEMVELFIPYERGDVMASVHREGEVLVEIHEDTGTRVRARLDDASRQLLGDYVVVGDR